MFWFDCFLTFMVKCLWIVKPTVSMVSIYFRFCGLIFVFVEVTTKFSHSKITRYMVSKRDGRLIQQDN